MRTLLANATFIAITVGLSPVASSQMPRKVLIEFAGAQDCELCRPGSTGTKHLVEHGHGTDRLIPIRRQDSDLRTETGKGNPILVNGRPIQPAELAASVEKELHQPAEARLYMSLEGIGAKRRLFVRTSPLNRTLQGRDFKMHALVVEEPLTGRLSFKTDHPVRSSLHKDFQFRPTGETLLAFTLESTAEADRTQVVAFVQDPETSKVFQVESVPWTTPSLDRSAERIRILRSEVAKRQERRNRPKPPVIDFFSISGASYGAGFGQGSPGSTNGNGNIADDIEYPEVQAPRACVDCGSLLRQPGSVLRYLQSGSTLPLAGPVSC